MRDSLLSSVCYYKSYLPSRYRSIFEKQYVFQSFDPGRRWIDALVHDHQTVLAKAEGGVVPYLLTMPRRFMPSRLHAWLTAGAGRKAGASGKRCRSGRSLYQEPQAAPVAVPMGKFAMYRTGNPMPTLSAWRRYGAWH